MSLNPYEKKNSCNYSYLGSSRGLCFYFITTFPCLDTKVKGEMKKFQFLLTSFMSSFWILSDTFLEAGNWMELYEDKVTSWTFYPGYFCLATFKGLTSQGKKEQITKVKRKPCYVGGRLAQNVWFRWQEVWVWIMEFYGIPPHYQQKWFNETDQPIIESDKLLVNYWTTESTTNFEFFPLSKTANFWGYIFPSFPVHSMLQKIWWFM